MRKGDKIKRSYEILIQDRIGDYIINTSYFEVSESILKDNPIINKLIEKAEAKMLNPKDPYEVI